jgi:hypothetical protein
LSPLASNIFAPGRARRGFWRHVFGKTDLFALRPLVTTGKEIWQHTLLRQ